MQRLCQRPDFGSSGAKTVDEQDTYRAAWPIKLIPSQMWIVDHYFYQIRAPS
jgi:hypothetical protein